MVCGLSFLVAFWLHIALCYGETEFQRWDRWWSYEGLTGPPAWGNFNQKWKLCTHGGRQSPIDILPTDLLYDSNLKHIFLSKHKVAGVIRNTGHDLTIYLNSSDSTHDVKLTDGPLSYQYKVAKIVIHFGSTDKQGSEHRINGKSFSAEAQIVAFNSQLYNNISIAEESNYGLAVISLLVSVNGSVSSPIGQLFSASASHVQYRGQEKALAKFSVHDLLPLTQNYITYEGSLTKPGCYETVSWIIMNKPVYMTPEQFGLLRQTVSTDETAPVKTALENNYRPVQNLNRRALRTNINFPEQKSAACDIKREKAYTVNQYLSKLK
ncbi:hypothetical protein EB796_009383 [Bugula neritina]|uniref:Alpha-carbonic anhydrase domain-containing protein n=1 Tax=Bugula neritina TaxID=10212 RepID=A0A7J7K3Z0_BUGNE|nr:hypothetical protein EB796_009383 [Bugula neritina]